MQAVGPAIIVTYLTQQRADVGNAVMHDWQEQGGAHAKPLTVDSLAAEGDSTLANAASLVGPSHLRPLLIQDSQLV